MLHHRFIGNSKAKNLIIFLHEGLGCIEMWKSFPQKVVDTLNCFGLVYDRAGYGKSGGSLVNRDIDYLHKAAEELQEFINELNLDQYDISLYGHSDGGSIALIYAGNHPKKLKYVITEAAHAFVEQVTLDGVKEAIQPFKAGKLNGLRKFHGDRFEEVFWAWNNIWLDPRFEPWNILEEVKRIEFEEKAWLEIIGEEIDQKDIQNYSYTNDDGQSVDDLLPVKLDGGAILSLVLQEVYSS